MEDERVKLLYVELPNLIHRILRTSMLPLPKNKSKVNITIEEIKKIANTECESVLANFKN